ncbi:diguanylate cyclase [Paenibacillus sp. N1-5-1-14]|uniref:GGDEF domain-containing protein n=1 Tax=Paenibacillus radicibacter TaxID=2972488 RepID=UPI00215988C7|nr:diguanylate cyclase [Paenibacillus radicibacter]MCR8643121.1 diguanylate cyclase [Paenibacillus radicibacter]
MKNDRIYVRLLYEFLFFILISLYLVFTIQWHPLNYVWFMIVVVLSLFSFMSTLLPALVSSIIVVFGYSTYILVQMYMLETVSEITFNDIVWLLSFPLAAFVAAHLGEEVGRIVNSINQYENKYEDLVWVDEVTGFMNTRKFELEWHDEVQRSVRYGRNVTVLLMEIEYFDQFQKEYGPVQTDVLLKKVAEHVDEVLRQIDKKYYFEDGIFAGILPETEIGNVEVVINRMTEKFDMIEVNRANRTRKVKLNLKFGYAGCPADGTDADELYDQAKQGLLQYVK